MSSPNHLLVVAHDADRGAEQLFLLRMVAALRDQPGWEVEVLLWQGGPLLAQLRTLAPVRVVDDLNRWWLARLLGLVGLRPLGARLKGLRLRAWMWRSARRFRVVLAHGARAGRPFAYAVRPLPVVVHLPGDGRAWEAEGEDWDTLVGAARGVVITEDAGRRRLEELGVDRPVEQLPSVVPASVPASVGSHRREQLGIPTDALLVGATGTEDWWRAPEPVVPVLWSLVQRRPDLDVHVLWACYEDDEEGLWPLRHDVRNAGLEDRVHIVAAASSLELLELCDLVLLATRPDTFRVVGVEVALAAKPVICFADGVADVALGDAAVSVPYLDVEAMGDALARLVDDPDEAAARGRAAVISAGRAQEATGDAPQRLLAAVTELLDGS